MMPELSLSAVLGLPEIGAGDDLSELILQNTATKVLSEDSVLIVAQKVVSKAEGREVSLKDVVPGTTARELSREIKKDARVVELILSESRAVIRKRPGLLIVEHRSGHILANAGIDASNIIQKDDDPRVLLWPADPDSSARELSIHLSQRLQRATPVIINDSIGRPWRLGTTGQAIGCFGLGPLWDQRDSTDRHGNRLNSTMPATADAIAAAASLLQGEAAESLPVVWLSGYKYQPDENASAKQLLRPEDEDLFR